MNGELKKVYLGRNINYPEGFAPFSGLDYLDSLTIGSKVTAIEKSAFAACPKLKDVLSYAEIVPATNEYAFTQSYLPNATLCVPYSIYDQYCTTIPWSLFGNIKNFEGMYNLVYLVDGEEYKKYVVEQGSSISAEEEPTKEGYTFSGWSEIPETMPAHNVVITGSFVKNEQGDANNDGVVDAADVVAIMNYILNKPGENFNEKAADVNGDGVINVADVLAVLNTIR